MTPKEREDAKRVSRVIRAGRKLAGVSQTDLAKSLNVTQATLSNLESEKCIPSVSLWYDLCDKLDIPNPTQAYRRGFIDRCIPDSPFKTCDPSAFRIPRKYSQFAATKVRGARLFIRYFLSVYGEEKLQQYFKHVGIDPDLFVVFDNKINMRFSLELLETLIQGGKLKPSDVPNLISLVNAPEFQGSLMRKYRACPNQRTLIKELISHMSMYEANCEYRVEEEGPKCLVFSVKPRAITKYFDHKRPTLTEFSSEYKKKWLQHFSIMAGDLPVRTETVESYFKGAPRCLYRVFV